MADQQSRGGKKQGSNNPTHPEQHQGVRADGRRDSDRLDDEGRGSDADRQGGAQQQKDDPSLAPESGDRKATG